MADEHDYSKSSYARCRLLELPSELRVMIYHYTFGGGIRYYGSCLIRPTGLNAGPRLAEMPNLSLLRSCKQVYRELWVWLRDHHSMRFRIVDSSMNDHVDPSRNQLASMHFPTFFNTFYLDISASWWKASDEDVSDLKASFDNLWQQMATFVRRLDRCRLTEIRVEAPNLADGADFAPYFLGAQMLKLNDPTILTIHERVLVPPYAARVLVAKTASVRTMLLNTEKYRSVMDELHNVRLAARCPAALSGLA